MEHHHNHQIFVDILGHQTNLNIFFLAGNQLYDCHWSIIYIFSTCTAVIVVRVYIRVELSTGILAADKITVTCSISRINLIKTRIITFATVSPSQLAFVGLCTTVLGPATTITLYRENTVYYSPPNFVTHTLTQYSSDCVL